MVTILRTNNCEKPLNASLIDTNNLDSKMEFSVRMKNLNKNLREFTSMIIDSCCYIKLI